MALVGFGSLAWLLGDLYWSIILRDLDEEPFPSIADGLYLAFYPPVYLALVMMLRRRIPRLRANIWLDGLMGALAVGAVVTAMVFSAIAATSEGNGWAIATNLAYPLADTLLLALVVGLLALTGWRADRSLAFLAAGFLLFGVTDTFYLYQVAVDTYAEWTLVDVGWPRGEVLMAFAAWQPVTERRPRGGLRFARPARGLRRARADGARLGPVRARARRLAAARSASVLVSSPGCRSPSSRTCGCSHAARRRR